VTGRRSNQLNYAPRTVGSVPRGPRLPGHGDYHGPVRAGAQGWKPIAALVVVCLGVAVVVVLLATRGHHAAAPSVSSTVSTAPTASASSAIPTSCTKFGTTWRLAYNKRATTSGNPVRILAACCQPTGRLGVNHCFLTVTLAGTNDRGCELVDIGENGLPAGPGKHERCSNAS
jgi:hypothetical protein